METKTIFERTKQMRLEDEMKKEFPDEYNAFNEILEKVDLMPDKEKRWADMSRTILILSAIITSKIVEDETRDEREDLIEKAESAFNAIDVDYKNKRVKIFLIGFFVGWAFFTLIEKVLPWMFS